MRFPIQPPVLPMLAKRVEAIPREGGWSFEPKWDGFRAVVFRDGDELLIQSRDSKPLDRYFPELPGPLLAGLPQRCVLDGEVVIAGAGGLDFDALQLRIHPAASRVKLLAARTPASVVFFDLLALGDADLRDAPFAVRRERLEEIAADWTSLRSRVTPAGTERLPGTPAAGMTTRKARATEESTERRALHLTPATRDSAVAEDWFRRFEGAGMDGVVAKALSGPYTPDKRTMLKVKHERDCDCVVAGFRWYKDAEGTAVGSLLLGLYDAADALRHVGVCANFTAAKRRELVEFLEPYMSGKDGREALTGYPWAGWENVADGQRMPGGQSRWSHGKDLSWVALRPELVVEVAYEHMQGDRFRHMAQFRRWRFDRKPESCTYAQLEVVTPQELAGIFQER